MAGEIRLRLRLRRDRQPAPQGLMAGLVARASRLRSHQAHPRATNPKTGIAKPRAVKSEIRNPKSEILGQPAQHSQFL